MEDKFNVDEFLKFLGTKREKQKRALEDLAKLQGRIARCPNCDYIIPFVLEGSIKIKKPGNIFCPICRQEFNENFLIREAKRFCWYEEAINRALKAAGFKGRIMDLRKLPNKKVGFLHTPDFEQEVQAQRKRIWEIFQSIIPEYDRV